MSKVVEVSRETAAWHLFNQLARDSPGINSPGADARVIFEIFTFAAGIALAAAIFPDLPKAGRDDFARLMIQGFHSGRVWRMQQEKENCKGSA